MLILNFRRNNSVKTPRAEKFENECLERCQSQGEKFREKPKPYKASNNIKCKINFDKKLFQDIEEKSYRPSRVEKKRLQPTFGIITSDVHKNLLNKLAYDENIIKMRIGYLQSYKLLGETQRVK